jgi:hypothetical protein
MIWKVLVTVLAKCHPDQTIKVQAMEVIKIKLPNIKFFFLLMPLLLTEANALESLVTVVFDQGDISPVLSPKLSRS